MAGNSLFDNVLTTTLENRTGKLADNMTKNNALLARLMAKAILIGMQIMIP